VRGSYQVTSAACAAVGVFLAVQGRALGITGQFGPGPGPGFFAFWVGVALAVLSAGWFARVTLGPAAPRPADLIPPRDGLLRVAAVVAALVGFGALLTAVGFDVAMFAFLLFLFLAFGREHRALKLALAVVGSIGVHYVLERLLRVPLPSASIELLRRLGL
jgi:hypothetical protein